MNLCKILNCKKTKKVFTLELLALTNVCSLFKALVILYYNNFVNTIHKMTKDLVNLNHSFVQLV